jgi:hypothetical protein
VTKKGRRRATEERVAIAKPLLEALRRLEDGHGRLVPEDVVEAAREPSSPLHGYFTWDDTEAAARYRLDQARTLIRSVRYERQTTTHTVRVVGYARDPDAGPREQGYRSTEKLRDDHDAAIRTLISYMAHASAVLVKAQELATALGIEASIDPVLAEVVKVRRLVEGHG